MTQHTHTHTHTHKHTNFYPLFAPRLWNGRIILWSWWHFVYLVYIQSSLKDLLLVSIGPLQHLLQAKLKSNIIDFLKNGSSYKKLSQDLKHRTH